MNASRTFPKKQRDAALRAVATVERRHGWKLARWAMRKHLAVQGAKDAANRKIASLQRQIADLAK